MKRFHIDTSDVDAVPNKVALVERNITPQGIALINPKQIAKRSPNDLVELAAEIQKADNYVKATACNKLQIIAEQIQFLQEQAKNILLEARENASLHHAACNFVKYPGHVYHLYQRQSGQYYFSMLSPEEWGTSAPEQIYKGSYRLEQDHSWTPLSQIQSKDNQLAMINKFIQSRDASGFDNSITNAMCVDSC